MSTIPRLTIAENSSLRIGYRLIRRATVALLRTDFSATYKPIDSSVYKDFLLTYT